MRKSLILVAAASLITGGMLIGPADAATRSFYLGAEQALDILKVQNAVYFAFAHQSQSNPAEHHRSRNNNSNDR